jgi:signal peptidase I
MNRSSSKYRIFLILLVIIFIFKAVVFEFYRVSSSSMSDTVIPGDFLLINNLVFGTNTPNRATIPFINYSFRLPSFRTPALREVTQGEIIVIKNNYYPASEKNLVKRVAATSGSTVTVIEDLIFVDGFLYNLKFSRMKTPDDLDFSDDAFIDTFTVPEDMLFVVGDNLDYSHDSRDFGFVKEKDIIGKVLFIYASFDADRKPRWSRFFRVPG